MGYNETLLKAVAMTTYELIETIARWIAILLTWYLTRLWYTRKIDELNDKHKVELNSLYYQTFHAAYNQGAKFGELSGRFYNLMSD